MYQMVCPCSNESSQVRCVALPYDRKAVGEDDLRETRRLKSTVTLTSPRSRAKLTECGFESTLRALDSQWYELTRAEESRW